MLDGQSRLALQTARELVQQVPEEMLKEQTDFTDAFIPTALHVLVRFGRWDDILSEPEPADYLPVTRSTWHYARALAYAATGRVAQAKAEQRAFKKVQGMVPETSILFQNKSQDILGVAEAMMAGEIAYRECEFDNAFEHLREAVRRDDALNYDEPWGWMQTGSSRSGRAAAGTTPILGKRISVSSRPEATSKQPLVAARSGGMPGQTWQVGRIGEDS